jgi:antirestriction protein
MPKDAGSQIYVGTYAKYNEGCIAGQWLDLATYSTKDLFFEKCQELHKDECDPELMFQNWEGIPKGLIGESFVKDELWDWLELDDHEKELLEVYQEYIDDSCDIDRARDAFMGKGYRDEADWAVEWLEQTGGLDGVPPHLINYIDYEAYARDARLAGDVCFVRHDGDLWVFSNH